ncbi:hypothetical protein evm_007036, partial [Chilo suppressalis]
RPSVVHTRSPRARPALLDTFHDYRKNSFINFTKTVEKMMPFSALLAVFLFIVGRESVLAAASSRELRCGRRLVSGLFSRPRLPLGYSLVATVPRGACRLNVSEIMPSDNYIALKISNSSYIMNGEFAVSTPGAYDAAGARFIYTRASGLDSVFALGPIQHPIDIMILYTEPNPSLRYEYFTVALPNEIEIESKTRANIPDIAPTITTKHIRTHYTFDPHPRPGLTKPQYPDLNNIPKDASSEEDLQENIVGTRKFLWKVASYTQCTRSCGSGIQLGKYRCIEVTSDADKEVSPVHCRGPTPVSRRHKCNNTPCPPRWRAAAWSLCPQCGPATRTRIVGCVQDHYRGITKVSDQKCAGPKPATSELCNVPECIEAEHVDSRVIRTREHTDTFRDGPVYTVSVNSSDFDVGPEYTFSNTVGWLTTEWSECVGWCVGGGVQSRGVRCADPAGCVNKAPEVFRSCTPKVTCEPHDGRWFTGEWSPCSSPCGGKQIRGVLCIGGSGRHLRDTACKTPRPVHEQNCGDTCLPSWYTSDWDQCSGNCSSGGIGVQRRSVVCVKYNNESAEEANCQDPKPTSQRTCDHKCTEIDELPPDIPIESHKVFTTTPTTTTFVTTTTKPSSKGCKDKLTNCALAVQARLCHYNYYVKNCCDSCNGR